jgi:parvulin-like peptidyl-prolyl isomerase
MNQVPSAPEALLGGEAEVMALLRRMELWPQLLRRAEEEAIVAAVPLPTSWLEQQREALLGANVVADWLAVKGWQEADLTVHLARPEALKRFARQRFGPGLEDIFLASQGSHDQIVYSLLRVRDAALAQELWIRLEEGETTFAEVAAQFSEGPEAARKGVIGPMAIGQLQPVELAQWLRTLRPGQLHPPKRLGEWTVLLRLEQLTPARFDTPMQDLLLQQQLDAFLNERVRMRLTGQTPDPIYYNLEPESQP